VRRKPFSHNIGGTGAMDQKGTKPPNCRGPESKRGGGRGPKAAADGRAAPPQDPLLCSARPLLGCRRSSPSGVGRFCLSFGGNGCTRGHNETGREIPQCHLQGKMAISESCLGFQLFIICYQGEGTRTNQTLTKIV